MEFVLVHRPIGMLAPESMKPTLETAKKMCANPQAFVPGGKVIASYYAIGEPTIYCIWDVSSFDALAPMLRNMSLVGWSTQVIPAEKAEIAIPKLEKAWQDVQAQMMVGAAK